MWTPPPPKRASFKVHYRYQPNKEPTQAPKTYDSCGNSLYVYYAYEWTTEFPAYFALLRWKHKTLVVDCGQKISTDKSAQTSTFQDAWIKFLASFTYLSLPVNGILEMWLGLLTFNFRSSKGSQKIS